MIIRQFRATRLLTESLPIIVLFLTRRPFSARMVHSRQSRAKRPFQPFFETENNVFRSPDGWLSQRSWVSDWRTPENGSEGPSLSDHRFSRSPKRAVLFLPSSSNNGTCASSPFPVISLRRRDKRPFRTLLRPLSRHFSPFEKNADFSPKSTFSASKHQFSPLFS